MSAKIYTTTNGLQVTKAELIEILDKYSINDLSDFYYGIFDQELKEAIKPYFIERMFSHGGLQR